MSVVRPGNRGGSDVYMWIETTASGELVFVCACQSEIAGRSPAEAIAHLRAHRAEGLNVPAYAEAAAEREWAYCLTGVPGGVS